MDDIDGSVVVVIYNKPGHEGACYTLRAPDGEEREIGDAQDDYQALAGIIDRAYGDEDRPY
jgi:hypothetical protein